MFPKYPYLDLSDRNLDFLTRAIREMENEVKNFVSLNAVKYANPIQWSIDRQYEKNTIVIDPLTGTAFISVQPVPNGVSLTRTQYWTVVFDLQSFVVKCAKNFTYRYEYDTTLTATFPSHVGDWLVWGDVLYKAKSEIVAGDTYVINSNIERITIEGIVISLNEQLTGEIQNRINADTTLQHNIDAEASARELADTTLQHNIDAEASARELADTTIQRNFNNYISKIERRRELHSRDFGAIGDGVTDDTAALQNFLNNAERNTLLIIDSGTYHTTAPLSVKSNTFLTALELGSVTFINQFDGGTLSIDGDVVWLSLLDFGASQGATGICIKGVDNFALNLYKCQLGGQSYSGASTVTFLHESGDFYNVIMDNCLIDGGGATNYAIVFDSHQHINQSDIVIRNCFIDNYLAVTGGVLYLDNITDCWVTNSIMRSTNTIIDINNHTLTPTYSFVWAIQCSIDCLNSQGTVFDIDPFCALYSNSYIVDRGAIVNNKGVYSLYDSDNSVQLPMMGRNIFIPEAPMTETFAPNTGRQTLWFTSTPSQYLMRAAWATFATTYSRFKLNAIAPTLGFTYGIGLKNVAGEILFMRYDFNLHKVYVELYDPDGVLDTTLYEGEILFDGHYFAITHIGTEQFVFSVSNNGTDYYDLGVWAFEETPKIGIIGVNQSSNVTNPNKISVESSYLY